MKFKCIFCFLIILIFFNIQDLGAHCRGYHPHHCVKDVVQGVGNAVNDAAQAAKKAAEDTAQAAKKAAEDTARAAQKAAEDTALTAHKAAEDTALAAHKAAEDINTAANKAVEDSNKAIKKAEEDTARAATKAVKDTERATIKAANDAIGASRKAVDDAVRAAVKAAEDINTAANKAVKDAYEGSNKAIEDVNRAVTQAANDTIGASRKAADDAVRAAIKAMEDTDRAAIKAVGDTTKTLEKAAKDTVRETDRGLKNIEEAGNALVKYTEREIKGTRDTLSNAEKRIREGKVIDAIWHLNFDPARKTEENLAKATQESSLINTVGQVAATAYGGPGGAAAYAAWYTYKQTGDIALALKVGIISGATSTAFGAVGDMPTGSAGQIAKKSLVAGAIGGLAVAASGGDETAIREGFLRSGGMVLIQDGYKKVTKHQLDARSSKGEAYCMSTLNVDCSPPTEAYIRDENGKILYDNSNPPRPLVDVLKTDPRRPHVGNWSTESQTHWNHERGVVMTTISRVPGMNAMSVFHDHWAVTWDMGTFQSAATIAPAVVLTYIGTGAPVYDLIQKTNAETNKVASNVNSVPPKEPKDTKDEFPSEMQSTDFKFNQDSNSGVASGSFLCVKEEVDRKIVIEAPSSEPEYACRVIYQSENGITVPWFAKWEYGFCKSKAAQLVATHVEKGWSCFGQ